MSTFADKKPGGQHGKPGGQHGKSGGQHGKPGSHGEREQSDLEEKVLFINRCAKVVKGGRRFSFSALILVGDHKGKVGFGFAKANELSESIKKAGENARKDLRSFEMEGDTIPHEVEVTWDGATVLLKPAKPGTGVIAGSVVRSIMEAAGVKDVVCKILHGKNPINLVRATFKGLDELVNRKECLALRGNES